jgi:hypothetical protein
MAVDSINPPNSGNGVTNSWITPEAPTQASPSGFQRVMDTLVSMVGGAGGLLGSSATGSSETSMLLSQQMALQMEMQRFSMASNIERTRHEMNMTPVRNMRLG